MPDARLYRRDPLQHEPIVRGRDALQEDLARLESVRQAVGQGIAFIVDVNGRWNVATCLRALPVLGELGITLLEQPVAAWDDRGQAEVVGRSTIEVMADEAVFGPTDVARPSRWRSGAERWKFLPDRGSG